MSIENEAPLRSFAVFMVGGDQCGDYVRGHEIDTGDPTLLRIVRIEADGTRRIVAAFNRSHVVGVSDVTED